MRIRLIYAGFLVTLVTAEIAWTCAIVFELSRLLGFEL
jgi:hypothetical protein